MGYLAYKLIDPSFRDLRHESLVEPFLKARQSTQPSDSKTFGWFSKLGSLYRVVFIESGMPWAHFSAFIRVPYYFGGP